MKVIFKVEEEGNKGYWEQKKWSELSKSTGWKGEDWEEEVKGRR